MHKIPTTPREVTAAWLTAALRQWGSAATVDTFTMKPLGEGQGFFGQLVRISIVYAKNNAAADSAHAPATLIAKFSSPVAKMRARSVDSYAREVRFYQRLAPITPLPTPICYFAEIDLATGAHLILLQDLVTMRVGSRVAGCTVEQAQVAVGEIVKLHTQWWGRTDAHELTWLAKQTARANPDQARQQYDAWWPDFYAHAQAQLPAELVVPSQQLGQQRAAIRQQVFGDVADVGGTPRTLIHRDFQLDNLFFDPTPEAETAQEEGAPFAVVDWQFTSRGIGVWDVAYFLSESLLPANRRRVEMALLRDYHQALLAQGIKGYSFDACYDDYRMALLQRHTALVSTIAAMPFPAAQRHIHINMLLPRNIAALLDHDAFAVIG